MKAKLVLIVWTDVRCTDRDWLMRSEFESFRLPTVTTIGFLLAENKEYLTVAPCCMEVHDEDTELFRPIWLIPCSAIKKISELEEKRLSK